MYSENSTISVDISDSDLIYPQYSVHNNHSDPLMKQQTSDQSATTASSSSSPSTWWSAPSVLYPCLSLLSLLSVGGVYLLYQHYQHHRLVDQQSKRLKDFHQKPLLLYVAGRRGRIQGCDWATKALRWDEDGDTAHEFLGPFNAKDTEQTEADTEQKKEESDKSGQIQKRQIPVVVNGAASERSSVTVSQSAKKGKSNGRSKH